MQRLKKAIWDPEKKAFLGKNGVSWLSIFLGTFVVCLCMGILFHFGMQVKRSREESYEKMKKSFFERQQGQSSTISAETGTNTYTNFGTTSTPFIQTAIIEDANVLRRSKRMVARGATKGKIRPSYKNIVLGATKMRKRHLANIKQQNKSTNNQVNFFMKRRLLQIDELKNSFFRDYMAKTIVKKDKALFSDESFQTVIDRTNISSFQSVNKLISDDSVKKTITSSQVPVLHFFQNYTAKKTFKKDKAVFAPDDLNPATDAGSHKTVKKTRKAVFYAKNFNHRKSLTNKTINLFMKPHLLQIDAAIYSRVNTKRFVEDFYFSRNYTVNRIIKKDKAADYVNPTIKTVTDRTNMSTFPPNQIRLGANKKYVFWDDSVKKTTEDYLKPTIKSVTDRTNTSTFLPNQSRLGVNEKYVSWNDSVKKTTETVFDTEDSKLTVRSVTDRTNTSMFLLKPTAAYDISLEAQVTSFDLEDLNFGLDTVTDRTNMSTLFPNKRNDVKTEDYKKKNKVAKQIRSLDVGKCDLFYEVFGVYYKPNKVDENTCQKADFDSKSKFLEILPLKTIGLKLQY